MGRCRDCGTFCCTQALGCAVCCKVCHGHQYQSLICKFWIIKMRHWGVILCETLWLFIILVLLALITIGVHAFSPEHVEAQAFGDTKVIINRNLSDGIEYGGEDSNKQVLYYPSNYFTDRVMAFVKNDSDFHRYSVYETSYGTKGYNDIKALLQDAKDNSTLAAVVFTVAEGNKFVKFEIRNRQYDVFKEQFDPYYHVKEINTSGPTAW